MTYIVNSSVRHCQEASCGSKKDCSGLRVASYESQQKRCWVLSVEWRVEGAEAELLRSLDGQRESVGQPRGDVLLLIRIERSFAGLRGLRMVDEQSIKELTERIVREFHPQKIILFGSYVTGSAGQDSDVDLLVILPFKEQAIRKSAEILKKVQPRIPVDLLVRTPDYIQRRLQWNDFFLREIM